KAEYQKINTNDGFSTQFEMLKKLEMPEEWHHELVQYANSLGIKFLSTGFDEDSIDFLDSLNIDFLKIPSGEITNRPYLEHIASKKRPVIISTGMAYLEEVRAAIDVLLSNGILKDNITVLHCTTEYPTPMIDVNLKAMVALKEEFDVKIGYSDHTLGIELPIAAVALGATVIEKHFTLDKGMEGPDHKASLDPVELKLMVKAIRNIEMALSGSGIKQPSGSELKNIEIARKSIHINKKLEKGHLITREDLIMMRPGNGVSPMNIDLFLNKQTVQDLPAWHKLSLKDIL
ncbi:MAG: N-acetylneuraminate synthase family protein, partial [Cyclobacteriaceae bacterium]|nr:N-acetylneuraminate synthase family protein [Cyclobacteriaceae bacterium]